MLPASEVAQRKHRCEALPGIGAVKLISMIVMLIGRGGMGHERHQCAVPYRGGILRVALPYETGEAP